MAEVWLALDDRSRVRLTKLLAALGAVVSERTVFVPDATKAAVFTVQNGQVIVLPKSHQLFDGRPIVGAVFQVRESATAARYLQSSQVPPTSLEAVGGRSALLVSPRVAHGLWLEFREEP